MVNDNSSEPISVVAHPHARIAPSSASRWVACPGSVRMQELCPKQETGAAASEGTASHWVGEQILKAAIIGAALDPQRYVGCLCPENEVKITQEMVDGAKLYADNVLTVAGANRQYLKVEQRISNGWIHPECFGTADAYLWVNDTLHIWDYKFGRVVVEAVNNWQAINYVANVLGPAPGNTKVFIHIVQPRAPHAQGPVRVWQTTWGALAPKVIELQNAAAAALGPYPRLQAGPHCKYCRASLSCSALSLTSTGGDIIERSGDKLGEELEDIRKHVATIKIREEAVESEMFNRLRSNQPVGLWTIGNSRPTFTWAKSKEEIIKLGELMGVDVCKPSELLTPKQAEAVLGKDVVKAYAKSVKGKEVLVKSNAQEVFQNAS